MQKVFDQISHLNDDEWLTALVAELSNDPLEQVPVPKFPPDNLQGKFDGITGETNLRAGFDIYRKLKAAAKRCNVVIGPESVILDFGCGWGRVLRCFLRDVREENLFGVDVNEDAVASCNETMPFLSVSQISGEPRLAAAEESFDVIYAYSAFAHLPERLHLGWVQEFARCLKPGGLLLATTQGRSFLERCHDLARSERIEHLWQQQVLEGFPDPDKALRDYDAGRFLFAPLPRADYGHTLVPKAYVANRWGEFLDVREFIDDPSYMAQALIVAQKPLRRPRGGIFSRQRRRVG